LAKFVQNEKIMRSCILKGNDEAMALFAKQIAQMSPEILGLRLSQPALRALVNLQIYTLADIHRVGWTALKESHGIGPSAFKKLESLR
jgi:hypothetical protein